jgi:dipeptidyl aminopeptidase/acylaminoacyl peptidase
VSARTKGLVVAICAGILLALPASALAVFPGVNAEVVFVSGIDDPANDDSDADLFVNQLGDLIFSESEALFPLGVGQRRHPNISPDGNKIAFALKPGADGDIYIHNRVTGSTAVMGTSTGTIDDDRPAWSPDNKRIAFESEGTGGEYDIKIFDTTQPPSATNPLNVTNSDGLHEGKPVWSPDGEFIYHAQGLASINEDIARRPAGQIGGASTNVVATGEAEYQPALDPTGTQLCYTRGTFFNSAADVYIRSSATGSSGTSGTDLSDTNNGGYNCAWYPDGSRIAYVDGVTTAGALVSKLSNDTGSPSPVVNDTASHFDGNPDIAREKENCDGRSANVIGTTNDDTTNVDGFGYNDIIATLAGDDTSNGKVGKDRICGKAGKDTLKGGADNDTLIGGADKDVLKGGPDKDKCFGNGGKDKFKSCEKVDQ